MRVAAVSEGVKSADTKAEEKSARRVPRATKRSDDDMFKDDAPRAVQTPAKKKPTAAKPAVSVAPDSGAVRNLKPFKKRAETIEIMSGRDPITTPFFKGAKWYTDENDNIILKFEEPYAITNLKMFGGESLFIGAVSEAMGRPYLASKIKYECETEKKSGGLIDKIIEAAEDN